jgi:hypothetical protein
LAALVLSLGVFAFLTLVGYAVLSLLARDEEPLYSVLLAPVTGAAVTILLAFAGNQLGVPIGRFGAALAAALVIGSLVVLWRAGRRVPGKDAWPFVVLALFALLATGWPMLKFGLDWVSFCNDDMANYCMGVERVLRHGYFAPPDAAAVSGADYTQFLWFLHVLHRPGSEMILAIVEAVTGIVSLRIFMPVMLAFTLCQAFAAGAMTYVAGRSRLATWAVVGLVALSPLAAFGALYQLIAQVIGLGLAAGLTAVLLAPVEPLAARGRIRRGVLIGLLLAGLIVAYTEVLPFVALAYFAYAAVTLRGGWAAWRRVLGVLGIAAVTVLVLLNRYFPLALIYVFGQAHNTAPENPATTMFPYYMVPTGPVYFWGLFPLGQKFPSDRELSMLIAVSLALCVAAAALVARSLRRKHAPAFVCAVMIAVFAFLFHKGAGFGMYKLAMYFQPFILATVALGWFSLSRRRLVQILPLLLLGLAFVKSHRTYTVMSMGSGRGFTEIEAASSTHLVREYAGLLKRNAGRPLESDTFNLVLAKFQMIGSIGRPLMLPSYKYMGNLSGAQTYPLLVGRKQAAAGIAAGDAYNAGYVPREFQLHPPAGSDEPTSDSFLHAVIGRDASIAAEKAGHPLLFVGTTGRQSPFNRWHDPEDAGPNFRGGTIADFPNHLIFIASGLGEPYFVAGRERVGIYQLESDVMFDGRTMAAAGRYLLFKVVHPSPGARLELELTDTIMGDGKNQLPPAEAIGAARSAFPILGRGSARVFSAPLVTQTVGGESFVAIDMGSEGDFIHFAPGGLMHLWGRSVRLDHRRMVGFLRDISLVSEAEYQSMQAPAIVERFPQDLTHRTLEYSGLYEDGYAGDRSFVALIPPPGVKRLIVEGRIPQIDDPAFKTEAVLTVDGKELLRRTLGLDWFRLSADVPESSETPNRHKIELTFSRLQRLPAPDGRPIGAQLTRIGFSAGPSTVTWSGGDPTQSGVESSGIFADGWTGPHASIRMAQPAGATRLVIHAMVPRINDSNFTTDVGVRVDGKQVARQTAGLGDLEIVADVPQGPAVRKVEITFSKLQRLPAPDTRSVSAQLKSVSFERKSQK